MSTYFLAIARLVGPAVIVHGGAGAYLRTTTVEERALRGENLLSYARVGLQQATTHDARSGALAAIEAMELDPLFNAGLGSKLQQDGQIRVSAAIMDGAQTRLAAVYNAQHLLHPTRLAAALLERGDRNVDGTGAARLMQELGIARRDLRTEKTVERWRDLLAAGDTADAEAAIGNAGQTELALARKASLPVPGDIEPLRITPRPRVAEVPEPEDDTDRFGTVGVAVIDRRGGIVAATSTGGRGHEYPGRISDSPTPAGNYATPHVALSATGFGEQILDLNLCGRIATRLIDTGSLEKALRRTFDEVVAHGGLLGVIALTSDGEVGYAHTTEACGVAWCDAAGAAHIDAHGQG